MTVELEYGVEGSAAATDAASTTTPRVSVPYQERTGLGYGLLVPFRRDRKTDFASGGMVTLVRSNVMEILGVRADDGRMTGELPWRPEFGCVLHKLRFMPIDETFAALARSLIKTAVARWEPRARITTVRVSRVYDSNQRIRAMIHVGFDVVQAGTGNVLVANQSLDLEIAA